jgi:hypothetical protein
MSGGFFDYDQYRIGRIADDVEQLILSNTDEEKNEWGDMKGRFYGEKTIDEFKIGLHHLKLAQIYAQRIDWLVSGDDGEETFHKRLASDKKDMLDE